MPSWVIGIDLLRFANKKNYHENNDLFSLCYCIFKVLRGLIILHSISHTLPGVLYFTVHLSLRPWGLVRLVRFFMIYFKMYFLNCHFLDMLFFQIHTVDLSQLRQPTDVSHSYVARLWNAWKTSPTTLHVLYMDVWISLHVQCTFSYTPALSRMFTFIYFNSNYNSFSTQTTPPKNKQ